MTKRQIPVYFLHADLDLIKYLWYMTNLFPNIEPTLKNQKQRNIFVTNGFHSMQCNVINLPLPQSDFFVHLLWLLFLQSANEVNRLVSQFSLLDQENRISSD